MSGKACEVPRGRSQTARRSQALKGPRRNRLPAGRPWMGQSGFLVVLEFVRCVLKTKWTNDLFAKQIDERLSFHHGHRFAQQTDPKVGIGVAMSGPRPFAAPLVKPVQQIGS